MKLKKRLLAVLFVLALSCLAAMSAVGCSKDETATVTFMVDNSVYSIVKVREGDESLPEEPEKDFYNFNGWFEDRELTTQFNFEEYRADKDRTDKIVYAGFTFNGNTYSVVLNGNGGTFGSDAFKTVNVREQETVNSVTAPVRENYVLTGWSENKKGTKPWNLSADKVTANTVLYAVWARVYTVTFDAGNGTFEKEGSNKITISLTEGYDLAEPAAPVRNNYVFAGWAVLPDSAEPDWDTDTDTVTADLTLYAVWQEKIDEYDVEFVLNYGGVKNEIKSTVRGLIAYEPVREGYVFNGWWNSDGEKDLDGNYVLTDKFDLAKRISEDGVKVYAKWINEDDICSVLTAPLLTVSSGTIYWTECEGAVTYEVAVWQGSAHEGNAKISTTTNDTSYSLPSYCEQGTYRIEVRAKGDGYTTVNSGWAVKTFEFKRLSAPLISFDITSSVLSWSNVRSAAKYELYIDGNLIEAPDKYYEYDLSDYEAGDYQIKIIVTAEGYTSATASATVKKLKLKTPQVTALYNESKKIYELNWNSVLHADEYLITVIYLETGAEFKYTTTGTKYTLNNTWSETTAINYKVKAYDSKADYLISEAKSANLGTPTDINIKLEGTSERATAYNILYSGCVVSFESNGGTKIPNQLVTNTRALKYPDLPTRAGYVFTGWYEDYKCTKLFDFSKEIKLNTTLYAGWYETPEENFKNSVVATFNPAYPGAGIGFGNLSNTGTSAQKKHYIYYCALTDGNYRINYTNGTSGSNYGNYFYAYNLTKDEIILQRTLVTTASQTVSERGEVEFTADAGDIIVVEVYRSNQNYTSRFEVFFYGGKAPAAGGKFPANHLSTGFADAGSGVYGTQDFTVPAGCGTVIKLTATAENSKFLGWHNKEGELISEEETIYYTVEGETTLTAKWE